MDKSIALPATSVIVTSVNHNDIRELSLTETLLVGAAGGLEEFPVIPR